MYSSRGKVVPVELYSSRGKKIHAIKITAAHELTFEKIRLLAKKTGFAWANNATISRITGFSKSYVSHLLTDLVRIGWMYRRIELDENKAFEARMLVPLDRLCPDKEKIDARIKEMEQQKDEEGVKNRLCHNGSVLGITPQEIRNAIHRFGADRIEELLCIIKASNTCKHPRKFFYAGLKKIFIAGKRAASLKGKAFITETPSPAKAQEVLGKYTLTEAIENATAPVDSAIAAMVGKMRDTAARCNSQA